MKKGKKRKKSRALIVLIALIAFVISIYLYQSNSVKFSLPFKKVKISGTSNYLELDPVFNEFHAGDSISVFLTKLSKPDKVLIDDDEDCPIGQLHIWSKARTDYEIIVLADDYSTIPNDQAKSRLFMIKLKEDAINQPCYKYGIRLGDQYDSVLSKINSVSTPIERTGASRIDTWIFRAPETISMESNGNFIDFIFVNRKLQLIRISNFDVFETC